MKLRELVHLATRNPKLLDQPIRFSYDSRVCDCGITVVDLDDDGIILRKEDEGEYEHFNQEFSGKTLYTNFSNDDYEMPYISG